MEFKTNTIKNQLARMIKEFQYGDNPPIYPGLSERRFTVDQVERLDMVIKAIRRRGKNVHLAFLDKKAASQVLEDV